ncbi:hypothetical protein BpHYR1_014814 [Brachionus plicatilis]|uniref:Uncharacterized protein n=1 Tax=Brachionus plicatilis TaxID=10195 RepID=A0A3M7R4T9_BRAPC|nr:hypothetical protein BpHYR1_014814 [Brachionus plicatilis]
MLKCKDQSLKKDQSVLLLNFIQSCLECKFSTTTKFLCQIICLITSIKARRGNTSIAVLFKCIYSSIK